METTPLFGAISALGLAVTTLWGWIVRLQARNEVKREESEKRLQGKLDQCEVKHGEMNDRFIEVVSKVSNLEGQINGYERAKTETKSEIAELSETVLAALGHKDNDDGNTGSS